MIVDDCTAKILCGCVLRYCDLDQLCIWRYSESSKLSPMAQDGSQVCYGLGLLCDPCCQCFTLPGSHHCQDPSWTLQWGDVWFKSKLSKAQIMSSASEDYSKQKRTETVICNLEWWFLWLKARSFICCMLHGLYCLRAEPFTQAFLASSFPFKPLLCHSSKILSALYPEEKL